MGNEANRVFCEHLGFAYRVALAATGDAAEAEDAVQDSYLRFVESWSSFDRSRPVQPYLARVVVHTAANRERAELRRSARETSWAKEGAVRTGGASSASAEELAALRAVVAALPADERLAVSLRFLEGLTIEDTAAALAVPRSTVSDRMRKGLDRVRKALSAAGFGAVAAPTALSALPRFEAPATLKAAVSRLATGKAIGASAGAVASGSAATEGAGLVAAAKGGLAMKLIAGVLLAGAVVGGVAIMSGGGGGLPAEKVPGVDFPYGEGVVYKREWLFGNQASGYEDGPAAEIETGAGTENAFVMAPSGNWYIVDGCVTRTVRKYDAKKKRVSTIAWAGPWGKQGGRAEAIRLGGSGYSFGIGVSVDSEETHLLLSDKLNQTTWRLDLKTGRVQPVPGNDAAKGAVVMAGAPDGSTYIAMGDGRLKKRSPGGQVQVLGVKLETPVRSQGAVVDGKQERLFSMMRDPGMPWGVVWYWDLKTGKAHPVAGPKKNEKPNPNFFKASGPADKVSFHCAAGFTLGPDKGQRYVYLGGGDESTINRIDLERKYVHKLVPADKKDGSLWTFGEGKEVGCGNPFTFPGAPTWGLKGEFYMEAYGKGVEVFRPVGVKK